MILLNTLLFNAILEVVSLQGAAEKGRYIW